MSVVLAVIAIAVLLVLAVASLRMQYEKRSTEKQEAHVRSHAGDEQREGSLRRRAEVRAATEERIGTTASPNDEQTST